MPETTEPRENDSADEHGEHEEHHGSMGQYLMVFLALLGLTTASFVIGSTMTGSFFGNTLMMAISCVKALLVMLFFMHLIWEANWKYVLTIPASFMSLFLVLALTPDIGFRTRWYAEERWLHAAEENLAAHDAGALSHDDHDQEGGENQAEAEKEH